MHRWLWLYPILAVLLSISVFFSWGWSWTSVSLIALVVGCVAIMIWCAFQARTPATDGLKMNERNMGKNMASNLQHEHHVNRTQNTLSRGKVVLVGFLIVAGYFLVTEHRAHLGGALYYLPFLFLLACPLMHMFMHGSHGGHDHGNRVSNDNNDGKNGDA
jgi:hypothetical protein